MALFVVRDAVLKEAQRGCTPASRATPAESSSSQRCQSQVGRGRSTNARGSRSGRHPCRKVCSVWSRDPVGVKLKHDAFALGGSNQRCVDVATLHLRGQRLQFWIVRFPQGFGQAASLLLIDTRWLRLSPAARPCTCIRGPSRGWCTGCRCAQMFAQRQRSW